MPVSVVISNLIKLGIQIGLLTLVFIYFYATTHGVHPQWHLFFCIPLLVIILGFFGLSAGIIFSSITTKYRDFTFLLSFAVQLLMFLSCVVFPVAIFKESQQFFIMCNPVAATLEAIKFIITGHGNFSVKFLLIDSIFVFVLFIFSVLVFNKTEKSFMDTV
jgi:lipopolysaccharide transport system permease protein